MAAGGAVAVVVATPKTVVDETTRPCQSAGPHCFSNQQYKEER